MPGMVADASIIAAMSFAEPRGEEVALAVAEGDLYEPTILGFELANIARTKAMRFPDRREAIMQGLRDALALSITWMPVDFYAVAELAEQRNLSAYDASYLYVAVLHDLPLLTLDSRLARAYHG